MRLDSFCLKSAKPSVHCVLLDKVLVKQRQSAGNTRQKVFGRT